MDLSKNLASKLDWYFLVFNENYVLAASTFPDDSESWACYKSVVNWTRVELLFEQPQILKAKESTGSHCSLESHDLARLRL